MLKQFYDISKKEVEEISSRIQNKDTEMEQMQDHHRVEVKVYMQKIKHLEYDHQNALRKVGVDGSETIKSERNYHVIEENTRKFQKVELRKQIRDRELANVQDVNYQITSFDKNMQNLQINYEN